MLLASAIRYSLRMLAKSPGLHPHRNSFAGARCGSEHGYLYFDQPTTLQELPVRQPDQLVSFGEASGGGVAGTVAVGAGGLFSYDFYRQIEKRHEFFQDISASASFTLPAGVRLPESQRHPQALPSSRWCRETTSASSAFNRPWAGPSSPATKRLPGRNPVAVLSYHYWQSTLASDPSVVGRTITVDKIPFTIIGVGPPRFFGLNADAQPPDLWLPLTMQKELMESSSLLDAPDLYWLHLMGRQNAGANMEQAQDWFTAQVVRYMRDLQRPPPLAGPHAADTGDKIDARRARRF